MFPRKSGAEHSPSRKTLARSETDESAATERQSTNMLGWSSSLVRRDVLFVRVD
jgi:hypothetical protein